MAENSRPLIHILVTSSAVASVGYNPHSELLEIRMKNSDGSPGKIYEYPGVPKDEYDKLMQAPSIGKHLAKHIRPKFSSAVSR